MTPVKKNVAYCNVAYYFVYIHILQHSSIPMQFISSIHKM